MPPALQEAETESEKQLERIEGLEQTLFELQGEIGAGRHLPPGVRVLSLRENPAQQWEDLSKAAMERLRGENEALLKQLKNLEESDVCDSGHAPNVGLAPHESYEAVNKEKQELAEELKRRDRRFLRLQEARLALTPRAHSSDKVDLTRSITQVFQAKSAEFREATASILGVKLTFYPNGLVRVMSQYDLNAAFVFQPTGAGEGAKSSS